MSWRLATSLETLRNQLNVMYPNRSKASDGTIGDAAHQATKSEHNPNSAGIVTAMDITHDPAHGLDGQQLADMLIQDNRTWYVIFNRRIWEAGRWKSYSGLNPHDKHVHISVKQDAGNYDNPKQWSLTKGGTMFEGRTAEDWANEAKDAQKYKQAVIKSKSWKLGMNQNPEFITFVIDSLEDYKSQHLAVSDADQKLAQIKAILK